MTDQPDFFRDFGIIPHGVPQPAETVRCHLLWGHVLSQYLAIGLLSAVGVGLGLLVASNAPFPFNVLASGAVFAGSGYLVYLGTRKDYSWVELDGETLRAEHLYTRRLIERPIEDIQDLRTLLFPISFGTAWSALIVGWLGRIRGMEIRFRDGHTPICITRADPAMKNAKELIEAIVFRMSEKSPIDAEVIHLLGGTPYIGRIHWKESGPTKEA